MSSDNKNAPSIFDKRILVAVSGLSPAILTETLFALAVSSEEKFIPTEVHLITTIEGKVRAENTLLKGNKPQFKSLCEDYQLENVHFDRENIHVIKNAGGDELDDIRSPSDNEAAADFISQLIYRFSKKENSALHVSIAGGRKTMGYYAGYALSLFGRPQDRLSHVLVEQEYERCFDFFYPTKNCVIANNLDGKPVDLSKAKVFLAEIPFVRISPYMRDNSLLNADRVSFSESVSMAQSSSSLGLKIDAFNNEITIGKHTKKWESSDNVLAFYIWFIEKCKASNNKLKSPLSSKDEFDKYIEFRNDLAEELIAIYEKVSPYSPHKERTISSLESGMHYGFFSEKKTLVKKALNKMFGPELAESFSIQSFKEKNLKNGKEVTKRKPGYFTMDIDLEDVDIIYP
jgi:CRISPR-associated protein (TIGR02584 family)